MKPASFVDLYVTGHVQVTCLLISEPFLKVFSDFQVERCFGCLLLISRPSSMICKNSTVYSLTREWQEHDEIWGNVRLQKDRMCNART